jgi:hypothetical protein
MTTPHPRRYRVFWALTLVCLGVGLLLAQTGWLSPPALGRLGATWPVFVILAGFSLVLRRYLSPPQTALALTAAFVVVCSGATVYAVAGPDIRGGTTTVNASEPRGFVDAASLVVNASSAALDVKVGNTGESLFAAHVTGDSAAKPSIRFDQSSTTATINTDTRDWWSFGTSKSTTITVTLSQEVGWSITVNGAAVDGILNLREAARNLQVNAAADNLAVVLDSPTGSVPIQFNGAAVNADMTVALGVPLRVTTSGVAASITVDGQNWSAIGQRTWTDPDFSSAVDRYDVTVNGASAQVRVTHDARIQP